MMVTQMSNVPVLVRDELLLLLCSSFYQIVGGMVNHSGTAKVLYYPLSFQLRVCKCSVSYITFGFMK
jgi:hypothetical protein